MSRFDLEWDEELLIMKTDRYCGNCMVPMHIHPSYGDIVECPKCRSIFKEKFTF